MEPSSKYAVDTTVDYGGGAVISLTKTIRNNLYTLNQDTDLSICYTNYNSDALTHIDQDLSPYNTEYDTSVSYGTISEASYSRTLKDWTRNAPAEKIFAGFALYYDTDNTDRSNFWGYRGSASGVSGDANGRFLHDIEYNKLVFPMGNISVYDKSVYDNIDYDTYPTNQYGAASTPSSHNISLSTLDANPNDYFVNDFSFSTAYIYRPDNNNWVSTAIRPVLLINGETAGGVSAYKNPFLGFYHSNIGTTTTNPNNNPSTGGGGETPKVYNKLSTGYSIGFANNFTIKQTKFATIQDAFTWGKAKYQEIYGSASGTHNLYFEHQEIDLGDSVMCLQWFIEIKYVGWWVPPYVNCNVQFYLKGSFVNRYLAGTGLYWSIDGSIPEGLTPTTLHTSNKIWLGAMNENGTTSGIWVKGQDIYTYNGYNKTGNTANPDYDPSSGGGGGGSYDDDPWSGASFSGVGVGGAGAFAKCYYMTSTELANLRSWMNSNNVPEGFDPMMQIIGLSQVPVSLSGDDNSTVQFVNSSAVYDPGVTRVVDSGVSTQIAMGTPKRYSLGSVNITRRMQERGEPYLDYDCQIELYLPLIGVFSLDTQAVMGRTITAEAVLDPISGTLAAYAYVSRDGQNLPIAYGSTTIGVDLPITAQQYSVARAALKQANAQLGTSLLSSTLSLIAAATAGGKGSGTGAKTATGSTNGLAAAGIREAGADYMKASQAGNVFGDFMQWGRTIRQLSYGNNTAVAGSFGGSTAQWAYPFTPYVKIIRPRYEKPSNYNHSQGVPCVQAKTVGSCTGFIQCIGVDVSGITGATDIELQAIQAALTNGVFAGGGS